MQNWLRRCISILIGSLMVIVGLACLSASAPVRDGLADKTSLTTMVPVEDSIPDLLPNSARYDSALEYATSDKRTDLLDGVARRASTVIARSLENGGFGETKRYDDEGEAFSLKSDYTGVGKLSTPDDGIWTEGDFADGKLDPMSVRWFKISDGQGQVALLGVPSKDGYWDVSYAADPEGAVGLSSTSLMVTAEGISAAKARELDKNALIGMILMMDEELPGWRDQR